MTETTTYRGRSLEEVLPRVREELGDDAVIERRRDGRVGGFAGFFQRTMVEVDARASAPGPRFDALAGADDDAAVREAANAPFADLLAAATELVPDPPVPEPAEEPVAPAPAPAPAPVAVAPSRAAAAHERRLVEHGLSPALAAQVVAEAVTHDLPFAAGRQLKRGVRAALARRLPVAPPLGGGGRAIALVGAGGAGRTRSAAGLAAAYARAGRLDVACLALGPADGGAELAALLAPHAVGVIAADDGDAARERLAEHAPAAVAILDTAGVSPRDGAAIAALAADLRAAGVTEAQVVLPATVALPVARALLGAFAPLEPAGIVVTHADVTDHLGPLVELAIETGVPLSYLVAGADPSVGTTLADPAGLAARLLP